MTKPMAFKLDSEVEKLVTTFERLIEALEEKLPDDYFGAGASIDAAEKDLIAFKRVWLAEQTARAR